MRFDQSGFFHSKKEIINKTPRQQCAHLQAIKFLHLDSIPVRENFSCDSRLRFAPPGHDCISNRLTRPEIG
jgi:hypothetical protein